MPKVPEVTYNPRKHELVIKGLLEEDIAELPVTISALRISWEKGTLYITTPSVNEVQVFRKTAIVIPVCWKNNEDVKTQPLFKSQQLAIYEVRQGIHTGYTLAVQALKD